MAEEDNLDDLPLEPPRLTRERPRLVRSSRRTDEFIETTSRNDEENRRISMERIDEQLRRDVEVVRDVLNAMEAIDNRDNRRSYLEEVMRNNTEYANIVQSIFRRRLVEDEIHRNVPTPDSYDSRIPLTQGERPLFGITSITGGYNRRKSRKSRRTRSSRRTRKSRKSRRTRRTRRSRRRRH
jgi:hypothetical protein